MVLFFCFLLYKEIYIIENKFSEFVMDVVKE